MFLVPAEGKTEILEISWREIILVGANVEGKLECSVSNANAGYRNKKRVYQAISEERINFFGVVGGWFD